MKFLVPNYSYLQNPWLGYYRPQIPFCLSSTEFVELPHKKILDTPLLLLFPILISLTSQPWLEFIDEGSIIAMVQRVQWMLNTSRVFLVTCTQSLSLYCICSSNDTSNSFASIFSAVPTYNWQTIADKQAEPIQNTAIRRNMQRNKVLKDRQTRLVHACDNTQGKFNAVIVCINTDNQTQHTSCNRLLCGN